MIIAINQYDDDITLKGKAPRKELLEYLGATHADKMYRDDADGRAVHIGYIVGGLWYTLYSLSDWKGGKS